MSILLTGAAGFIGYHVAEALLARGERVIGVDSLTPYYDVRLKRARLDRLASKRGFSFHRVDIAERAAIDDLISQNKPFRAIVHLAAQAGVRQSLVDPYEYVQANVLGHLVILEAARRITGLRHIVYASSSSVYGANTRLPFTETDRVDTPVSLYAATKRAGELMGYTYAHLFGLSQTGLRFFTVYGPWGRPDMAYYSFARAIVAGEPITLYEGGTLRRDFTYIDDIVAGVVEVIDRPPSDTPPARVLNIGNHRSEPVSALIGELERALGRRAVIRGAPRPLVDVKETFASVDAIAALTGFVPRTTLAEGIPRFVSWFREWHGVSD